LIIEQDNIYATLDNTSDINLSFEKNPKEPEDGWQRDYLLFINGRYQQNYDLNLQSAVSNMSNLPRVFNLSQNYPNPFNPSTTIKYALPKDVNVNLKIYDLLGREVKTLVNEFKKAGYYEITFNFIDFASGVYFYRIEAGNYTNSKKMVIVK
jgi:hypothetical protein